ncbi:MAG: type II toxin-antitoxin system Phd/YefM family antitoxin, partial [Ruminococcus sp.]|nr:type II toxin-antitoxin system Phd/YefM family antitoxin [Ruminococcus sp.]
MLIKASATLRNDYASISALAKETKEPIYITKNGE